jgi:hypothetical protein
MMLEIVTTEFHVECTILVSAQGGDFQQTLFRHTCQVHSGHNTSKDVPHDANSRPNLRGLPITSTGNFLFTVTQSLQWCATNAMSEDNKINNTRNDDVNITTYALPKNHFTYAIDPPWMNLTGWRCTPRADKHCRPQVHIQLSRSAH